MRMLSNIVSSRGVLLRYPSTRTGVGCRSVKRRYDPVACCSVGVMMQYQPILYHGDDQQRRWMGRKGGASAFSKPRPPTRKQRKTYHRKLRLEKQKQERHSPHNSKATERKKVQDFYWDYYYKLKDPSQKQLAPSSSASLEYDYGDALLEDLMNPSNSSTFTPTPTPIYLGPNDLSQNQQRILQLLQQNKQVTDEDISALLRSYRDVHSKSKNQPLGIAKALHFLLQDINIPINKWGQRTFASLMTCASTPNEGRRILKLMEDQNNNNNHNIQIQPNSYIYSILLHTYTRIGDFRGAASVLDEMTLKLKQPPSLPAYTSFIASCYKVVNQGASPTSIKAEAGKLAWNKWKEMRMIGLEADAMAYGAMIRILAARGLPEQAIGLIEEMQTMGVKPTTLIFTSALKAVARSHSNAIRFHGGRNKGMKRREQITKHHGIMTRNIVIAAETAEVPIDDGYIAALILCAATAGDAATAKAIYLAHQVRQLTHLRTIGSDQHLASLQGNLFPQTKPQLTISDGQNHNNMVAPIDDNQLTTMSFGEREYGKDSRILTALLHANAKAMENKGLGNMWASSQDHSLNLGYLCETSLHLLTTRPKPQYRDTSIPGLTSMETGLGSMTWDDEQENVDHMSKKLRRAKFRGLKQNDDIGNTIDDIDPMFYNMFQHDPSYDPTSTTDNSQDIATTNTTSIQDPMLMLSDVHENNSTLPKTQAKKKVETKNDYYFDEVQKIWKLKSHKPISQEEPFDVLKTSDDDIQQLNDNIPELKNGDFETFYRELLEEIKESGEDIHVDRDEAKEIFFNNIDLTKGTKDDKKFITNDDDDIDFESFFHELNAESGSDNDSIDREEAKELFEMFRSPLNDDDNDEVDIFGLEKDSSDINNMGNETNLFQNETKTNMITDGGIDDDFESFYEQMMAETSGEDDDDVLDKEEARELYQMMMEDKQSQPRAKDNNNGDPTNRLLLDSNNMTKDDYDGESMEEAMSKLMKEYDDLKLSLDDYENDGIRQNETSKMDEWKSGKDIENKKDDNTISDLLMEYGQDSVMDDKTFFHDIHYDDDDDENDAKVSHELQTVSEGDLKENRMETLVMDPLSFSRDTEYDREIVTMDNGYVETSLSTFSKDNVVEPMLQQKSTATLDVKGDEYYDSDGSSEEKQTNVDGELEIWDELDELLKGMPESRIRRVREEFLSVLGTPSVLRLVPILREKMPEYLSSKWLKGKNLKDADIVLEKAKTDEMVDIHVLNSMLEVMTSYGDKSRAIDFHEKEYNERGLKPTTYSDRLVLQMLVQQKQPSEALSFKQKVESEGRHLDLLSYGSLIQYYANKEQLGSAMMILKECIAIHGSPPAEASLRKLRQICIQTNKNKDEDKESYADLLTNLIGEDPVEWVRYGERNLKREYSKKGRRNVLYPHQRLVQV